MALTKVDISLLEDVSGANNLVKLDANAKIPAGTGANLLNKPGAFTSASDPTKTSNKVLGTEWLNTTSGEMYICTDATTGSNIWTNVGEGTDDIAPWSFQGSTYGYTMGGWPGPPASNVIDKFSFTTDGNATDVGDLTQGRTSCCGQTGSTYGYTSSGRQPWATLLNIIDKHSFVSDGDATDSGDLTAGTAESAGHSSGTYGYVAGGQPHGSISSIQKFNTESGGNASAITGVLTVARANCCGTNSSTHGYTTGASSPYSNVIEKFSFSTEGNSTDVGDLIRNKGAPAGQSSTTHGFASDGGGEAPGGYGNSIDKFAFASDGNAADHGDLSRTTNACAGTSSTTHGYTSGGYIPNYYSTNIDKFAYGSNTTAADVGDLTVGRGEQPAGSQV